MPDVAQEIVRIVSDKLGAVDGPLNLSDPLDELGLNSIDVVNVIFDIEEKYDIQIPFNANFDIEAKTIADLVRAVEGLVAAKAGAA